ncbi:MAG: trypsin-like serine protease [Pseudomonadota bacterium]
MLRQLAATALLLATLPVQAIVMRDDVPREDYRCDEACAGPTALFHLGNRRGGGAGTLIAPRWVLTAAHVAEHVEVGDTVSIGDDEFEVAQIALHPQAAQRDGFVDAALVQLSAPSEVIPAAINGSSEEAGKAVAFIGAGAPGDGRQGLGRFDGVVRRAGNRIEETRDHWLVFTFDAPDSESTLADEGISGPGDSGGPAFLRDVSGYCVAGISSWQDNDGQEGVYGVREFYVRTASIAGWISETLTAEDATVATCEP